MGLRICRRQQEWGRRCICLQLRGHWRPSIAHTLSHQCIKVGTPRGNFSGGRLRLLISTACEAAILSRIQRRRCDLPSTEEWR